MESSVICQIHRLRQMSVGELRIEWERMYGEQARSRNRDYLWRRLAWRVQELAHGGLSDCAQSKLEQLSQDVPIHATTPKQSRLVANAGPKTEPARQRRDPRLPAPGTIISKLYKGTEIQVTVRDDGFEIDGTMFSSLTAVAKHVTGCRSINGRLFFGLSKRKRK